MDHTNQPNTAKCRDSLGVIDRLQPPDGPVKMVLDTDAYNEIDDQFALVYALLSESLDVEAVYAAPFHNQRSTGPADGMKKSYNEIIRLLELFDHPDPEAIAFRGATDYMSTTSNPVASPATEDLIKRTANYSSSDPLYIAAIGAPTNVSSAIERVPELAENIVVVWLGGHPHTWYTAKEFNLRQDLHASRVLFDSGVPLVQIPCKNVAEHIRTTESELRRHLREHGDLGAYLYDIFVERQGNRDVWSKEIWDLAAVAFLADPTWVPTRIVHSPILTRDLTWSHDSDRHFIRVAVDADHDAVFRDFFLQMDRYTP